MPSVYTMSNNNNNESRQNMNQNTENINQNDLFSVEKMRNLILRNYMLFTFLFSASAVFFMYLKAFENMIFLTFFAVFTILFAVPFSPLCLLPAGHGSSELALPNRPSKILTVEISDPPVKGSKPLNFQWSPAYIEYKIAAVFAPSLYQIGATPNMVTLTNVVYRMFFMCYVYSNPQNVFTNWAFMWSSQILDCLDGLMARRYNMGSEFGAWLDITLDDAFGITVMLMLLSSFIHHANFVAFILVFCFVLIPMSSEAYMKSMKITNADENNSKMIGPGGSRSLNPFEFFGCFLEEYMAFFLFLVCSMLAYAHANNYWKAGVDTGFLSELNANVTDLSQVFARWAL